MGIGRKRQLEVEVVGVSKKAKMVRVAKPRRDRCCKAPEVKWSLVTLSANIGNLNSSSPGTILNVCAPGQGTSSSQRIGDKIFVKYMDYDLTIMGNSLASTITPQSDTNDARFVIWKSSNPKYTTTALFEANYFEGGAATPLLTATKAVQSDIVTLHDKTHCPNRDGSVYPRAVHFKGRVQVNKAISFTPGTSTAEKGQAGIYMVANTALSLPAANPNNQTIYVNGEVKWGFTDE